MYTAFIYLPITRVQRRVLESQNFLENDVVFSLNLLMTVPKFARYPRLQLLKASFQLELVSVPLLNVF